MLGVTTGVNGLGVQFTTLVGKILKVESLAYVKQT